MKEQAEQYLKEQRIKPYSREGKGIIRFATWMDAGVVVNNPPPPPPVMRVDYQDDEPKPEKKSKRTYGR